MRKGALIRGGSRQRGEGPDSTWARGTFVALVSLPSLMIALLMPCSVVVYLLIELLACSKESAPLAG